MQTGRGEVLTASPYPCHWLVSASQYQWFSVLIMGEHQRVTHERKDVEVEGKTKLVPSSNGNQ